jgi:hypothetical protein
MTDEQYVWIPRWRDFQHYKPNPDRGPAWIKTHTAQLHDDRYLGLTDRQRSLLHDLRMMFATFRGRLGYDRRRITRQRNLQTRHDDVMALVHAGLIDICSREALELRLEEFYGGSSLEVEQEEEEEKKPPTQPVQVDDARDPEPDVDPDFRQAVLTGNLELLRTMPS